jgi:single-strand DNA-binding protein
MNRVTLIGRLGKDPEIKRTQGGDPVATLSLATDYRGKDGEKQTDWHRVVAFGRTAEVAEQYLAKGRQVAIEGRLKTREWQDDSGQRRWTTEVVVQSLELLGSREDRQGDQDPAQGDGVPPGHRRMPPSDRQTPPASENGPPPQDVPPRSDDDIPF